MIFVIWFNVNFYLVKYHSVKLKGHIILFPSSLVTKLLEELAWPWSYDSWTYNYLCNQWLSPLMLWVLIPIVVRCTTLYNKVCQWLATGWWFSLGHPVSSINKTDRHDIAEILLKVALNTIKPNQTKLLGQVRYCCFIYTLPKFGSINGRSMNMHYHGTSKSSTIWLPNRK